MNASPATAVEFDAALRLLNRSHDIFTAGGFDPAGLFVSRDAKGTVCGAMMAAVLPGALGLAWPPVGDRPDALVAAACDWLRSRGVKVCQAFSLESGLESFAALERGGFQKLTRIIEMRGTLPESRPGTNRLTCEPVSKTNRSAFNAALLASYEGSLDCPEVNGDRTEAELLAPYADADAKYWWLAKLNNEPAGVLLVDAQPGITSCVVSYVGLAPNFRSRGFGSELMRFALDWCRDEGYHTVLLSVDERNSFAIRLYETLGFQASGVRCVFLATWPALS